MTGTTDSETTSPEAPMTAFAADLRLHEPRALGRPEFRGRDREFDPEEEADVAPKTRGAGFPSELASLQRQAAQALRAYVLATLDHVSARVHSADAPASLTVRNGHLRGQGLAVNERLDDFIESARQIVSVVNEGEKRPSRKTPPPTPDATRRDDEPTLSARLNLLTPRENTVLELLLKGLPNKQISFQLGISVATAKAHIGNILRKLNVSNRARVIALLANVAYGADGGH